ncbi:hypothetical protein BC829DRAFT_421826 [Chytridium lagenaria]|nr:hypothetical protein BC829DRAFT_421826 [Chytridium lagenaria]
MYCPCCDEEVESITTASIWRTTCAVLAPMGMQCVVLYYHDDETGFLGIRIPGLASILGGSHPPFSNLNEVQQQKNAVRRATIICKRSQHPKYIRSHNAIISPDEAEKKAMDVLLTEIRLQH